jgi:PST family polysaccharide transporter
VAAVMFSKSTINLYQMGALANSGSFFGGIVAVVVLLFTFFKKERNFFQKTNSVNVKLEKGLGLEIILIIFFTGITIFYQFIDSFSMLRLLMRSGMPLNQAEIMKGVFDRAQPLIQLGIVISLSFISTIMPQLRQGQQSEKNKSLINSMVRVCIVLAIAETAGLIALMPDVNTMLFTDSTGSVALAIYMCSIFFVSTINLLIAVTSGDASKNFAKLLIFIFSLIIKIGLNIILIPRFHISGAALATVGSEIVILIGLILIYRRDLEFLSLSWDFMVKSLSSGLIMALSVRALEQFTLHFIELTRGTSVLINLILIPVGILIFVFLIAHLKILKKSEWEILPLGAKITKFIKVEE